MRFPLLLALAASACASPVSVPPVAAPSLVRPTLTPRSPTPTAPVVRIPCEYAMGGTLKLEDPSGTRRLDVTLSSVAVSRGALADYGRPPSQGNFVTVQAKILNRGTGTAAIDPLDFLADAGTSKGVTVQQGSAPYSGASGQLGATPIDPGETITGPLTWDLSAAHGTVRYAPGGKLACTWRF